MAELIAGHTERMLIEYFVQRRAADCPSVVRVFIRERLRMKQLELRV